MTPLSVITVLASALLGVLVLLDTTLVLLARPRPRVTATLRLLLVGALIALIVVRTTAIDFAAIYSQFDSLVIFAAMILTVVAMVELRTAHRARHTPDGAPHASAAAHPATAEAPRESGSAHASAAAHPAITWGATIVALVLLAIASSPLVRSDPGPVMPALRSIWLPLHIGLAFLGEALFTVGFVGSIVWLTTRRTEQRPRIDRLVYRSIAVGYGLFTVGGLIFGAIWAQRAWGRYWGWDPKETWALVTWIVYSVYLHARLRKWGRGAISHWISIIGYSAAMFTLFGVNLLYRSLHAY